MSKGEPGEDFLRPETECVQRECVVGVILPAENIELKLHTILLVMRNRGFASQAKVKAQVVHLTLELSLMSASTAQRWKRGVRQSAAVVGWRPRVANLRLLRTDRIGAAKI